MRIAIHNNALRVHDNELLCLPDDVHHVYVLEPLGGAKHWWLSRALTAHARVMNRLGYALTVVEPSYLEQATTIFVNQHPLLQVDSRYVVFDNGYLRVANGGLSQGEFVERSLAGDTTLYSPLARGPALSPSAALLTDVQWPVPAQFDMWHPGEQGAWARLQAWSARVTAAEYGVYRGYPSTDITSRLSPHIANGEITPRQIMAFLSPASSPQRHASFPVTTTAHPIVHELHWREFKHDLFRRKPYYAHADIYHHTAAWTNNPSHIEAWKRGRTGFPLVDAGMRELWLTGFMDNRVRMVVASFLVALLNVDWRIGARWFMDTLVDADEAINATQWQSANNNGVGRKPYPVIMNPSAQEKKFDAASYIQRWAPIKHEPIINYELARESALRRYAA